MPAATDSPRPGSSPVGGGVSFSTPDTGQDLIHTAQKPVKKLYESTCKTPTPTTS